MVRKIAAVILIIVLFIVPVFAADTNSEVVSSVEDSSFDSEDSATSSEADTLAVLEEISNKLDDSNEKMEYMISVILASTGALLGFLSGKELLKIWID